MIPKAMGESNPQHHPHRTVSQLTELSPPAGIKGDIVQFVLQKGFESGAIGKSWVKLGEIANLIIYIIPKESDLM